MDGILNNLKNKFFIKKIYLNLTKINKMIYGKKMKLNDTNPIDIRI